MRSYNLGRFENAQRRVYETALLEIRAGRKRTHWMWFVFPQVIGLGLSETSVFYAIDSIEEAQAYLAHPILGARLGEATKAMNANADDTPSSILGATDAAKFRSSMTLFNLIDPDQDCFRHALDKFFGGQVDEETVRRVGSWRKVSPAGRG